MVELELLLPQRRRDAPSFELPGEGEHLGRRFGAADPTNWDVVAAKGDPGVTGPYGSSESSTGASAGTDIQNGRPLATAPIADSTTKIADGDVGTADLANGGVATADVANLNVTTGKITDHFGVTTWQAARAGPSR